MSGVLEEGRSGGGVTKLRMFDYGVGWLLGVEWDGNWHLQNYRSEATDVARCAIQPR